MPDIAEHVEYLKHVPIFKELPAAELQSVARSLKERVYEPGEVIVREGDAGMGFYLIADGQVEVSHQGHPIRTMGSGEFFGEMALMEERARTATVTAKTRTRCLQLVRWDFRALLKEYPELAVKMLEVVVRRLREHPSVHDHD